MVHRLNKKTTDIKRKLIAGKILTGESAVTSDELLESGVTLATECITGKFPELLLKDKNRLSKGNTIAVYGYIVAMKREINP